MITLRAVYKNVKNRSKWAVDSFVNLVNILHIEESSICEITVLNAKHKKMAISKAIEYIQTIHDHFSILINEDKVDELEYSYSCITHHGFEYIKVTRHNVDDVITSRTFMESLTLKEDFVQVFYKNDEYSLWQNEKMVSNYKWKKKDIKNLKIYKDKNTGWEMVDITKNPGRTNFKSGYIEAVASTMWLSDTFFELTGADKQKLNDLKWLQVEQLSDTVIKITSWPEPFNSAEGEQGRRQIELRKILYPNSKD